MMMNEMNERIFALSIFLPLILHTLFTLSRFLTVNKFEFILIYTEFHLNSIAM